MSAVVEKEITIVVTKVESNNIVTAAGGQGPPGPNLISNAYDLDVTDLSNGSVLVYAAASSKWTSTKTLENQIIESGQY